MRRYQTLIQEAELMALPPESVARFLKQRSRHRKRIHNASDPVDREVEESLLGRNEPLIDLALARYSLYAETVATLFSAAASDSGLRIACLSNDVIGQVQFNNFPLALFGGVPAMLDWLAFASDQEFSSLFENPALDDSFLVDLLERRHDWQALPEEKLVRIASALTRNPRMTTSRLGTWTDGYADYLYGAVFAAAWKLAWSINPSDTSAFALGWLYERLIPDGVLADDAMAIAGRWRVPAGSEAAEREAKDNARSLLGLGDWQRVRKGLARLALFRDQGLFATLIASDDIAFRCAAYAAGDMTAEQIKAAFERDGGLAYYELLNNPRNWRTPAQRKALGDAAWRLAKAGNDDQLAADLFNRTEGQMRTSHPKWFVDETESAIANSLDNPALRSDIAALAERLEANEQAISRIARLVEKASSRTGWIWWFSLGALAASLWRH